MQTLLSLSLFNFGNHKMELISLHQSANQPLLQRQGDKLHTNSLLGNVTLEILWKGQALLTGRGYLDSEDKLEDYLVFYQPPTTSFPSGGSPQSPPVFNNQSRSTSVHIGLVLSDHADHNIANLSIWFEPASNASKW